MTSTVRRIFFSGIPQERGENQAPAIGHSEWKPHPIQGWAPDFIPHVLQEAIDNKYYDELIPVPGPAGIEWSGKLARHEGILTGISGTGKTSWSAPAPNGDVRL